MTVVISHYGPVGVEMCIYVQTGVQLQPFYLLPCSTTAACTTPQPPLFT